MKLRIIAALAAAVAAFRITGRISAHFRPSVAGMGSPTSRRVHCENRAPTGRFRGKRACLCAGGPQAGVLGLPLPHTLRLHHAFVAG